MGTRYYVNEDGAYIGGFAGVEPPVGAIEVPSAPEDYRQIWSGEEWLPLSGEALASDIRMYRDRLLRETDIYFAVSDYPISAERKAALSTYRQALRDIPEQEGFPDNVVWPIKPE